MRLFFALQLPDDVRSALRPHVEAAQRIGRESVGFTRVEQLHFTLAFLGETERVDDAVAAVPALPAAFELSIAGRGAFPGLGRPRVLWLGVGEGAQPLCDLAAALCTGLRESGFKLDDRPFKPHLTLGRVKPRGDKLARRALEAVPAAELARFTVREIALVQSVLGSGGAKHTPLRTFSLR
jgi:2'-5' RNA ligase